MGGLFSSKTKTPKTITEKETDPEPVVDEQAIEEDKKRKIAADQQRSGRQSTVLDTGDTLG